MRKEFPSNGGESCRAIRLTIFIIKIIVQISKLVRKLNPTPGVEGSNSGASREMHALNLP